MSSSGTVAGYRCGVAARWLPRTLSASVLAAATLAAFHLPASRLVAQSRIRPFLVLLGGLLALWVLRKGREVAVTVRVTDGAVQLALGPRLRRLPLEDVTSIAFRPPFGLTRHWLPATVLTDVAGGSWRIPALLDDGERFVADVVRSSGRSDLEAWVATLKIAQRMSCARLWTAGGYATALAIVGGAVAVFHG